MNPIEELKSLLFELTAISGVSGTEQNVVRFLRERLIEYADSVEIDPFGNLIATKKGGKLGPRYMFAAHSDEVGGIITAVTEDGFLRFRLVGIIDPTILPGLRLKIDGRIPGTVVSIPGHTGQAHGASNRPAAEFIDIGASSQPEAASWGIQPGTSFSFDSPLIELNNPKLLMGKAIDNRIGCAVLIKTLENLSGKTFPGTLYGVVTTQEEIGMRGARMVSNKLKPDFAVALDTVPLDDTPLNSMPDVPIRLGGGPVVQLWEGKVDAFLGTVAHHGVTNMIKSTAQQLDIPLQFSAAYGNWVTDGAAIHVSAEGIPTGFLSIPRRYGHSPNEIVNLEDAGNAIRILTSLAEVSSAEFNADFIG